MLSVSSTPNLFTFIHPEHAFFESIQRLRQQLSNTPRYREKAERVAAGEPSQVRVSLKAHPKVNSQWRLKGFCLSLQFNENAGPLPFDASTFICCAKKGSVETFDFPQDPALVSLDALWRERIPKSDPNERFEVLRYYPGKRLTFRQNLGSEGTVIGKVMNRGAAEIAYDKLCNVWQTVSAAEPGFSVAAPKGMDLANSVFVQEERPGTPLARLIDEHNYTELLFSVGQIHRRIHSKSVPGLRTLDFDGFLRSVRTAMDWICFCRPEAIPLITKVKDLLILHPPFTDPSGYAFCHGDFSSLQVLKSNGNYSVIDFDDCILGDPYLEMARFISFLKYDVPFFRNKFLSQESTDVELERAYEAYLAGYQEEGKHRVDHKRLLWLRICCEMQYLFRLFKRDLFQPIAYKRTMNLISGMCRRHSRGEF